MRIHDRAETKEVSFTFFAVISSVSSHLRNVLYGHPDPAFFWREKDPRHRLLVDSRRHYDMDSSLRPAYAGLVQNDSTQNF